MRVINTNLKTGKVPAAGSKVVSCSDLAFPATFTLTSTDGTRKIEFSNDGTNFFQPTYDQSPAAFLSVAAMAPVKLVKFTGAENDPYTIL